MSKYLEIDMLKWTYVYFYKDYKVATLSTLFQTVTGIIMSSLKLSEQSYPLITADLLYFNPKHLAWKGNI